jgi:hypothetical protein
MIFCDHHIEKAIAGARLVIDPQPDPSQYDSSSVNLRVGDDFRIWKETLKAPSTEHYIDLDNINLADIIDLTDPLEPDRDGFVIISPGAFVLVRTLDFDSPRLNPEDPGGRSGRRGPRPRRTVRPARAASRTARPDRPARPTRADGKERALRRAAGRAGRRVRVQVRPAASGRARRSWPRLPSEPLRLLPSRAVQDALCFRQPGGCVVAEDVDADDDPAVVDGLLDGVVRLDLVPLGHDEVADASG